MPECTYSSTQDCSRLVKMESDLLGFKTDQYNFDLLYYLIRFGNCFSRYES